MQRTSFSQSIPFAVVAISVVALAIPPANCWAQQEGDKGASHASRQVQFASRDGVALITQMLGQKHSVGGLPVGEVDDFVLDFETGHVVFVISRIAAKESQSDLGFLILPMKLNDQQQALAADRALRKKLPSRFTRKLASSLYVKLERDIYWLEFCRELTPALRKNFNTTDFELTAFSHAKNRPVIDAEGESVGKIVDFGIDQSTGEVAYCVLETAFNPQTPAEYRAIPLGAFVMESGLYRWMIELDKQVILAFESFQPESPPTAPGEGWTEFVTAHYDGHTLQTKSHRSPEPPSAEAPSDPGAVTSRGTEPVAVAD